jgi:hypothetical protein
MNPSLVTKIAYGHPRSNGEIRPLFEIHLERNGTHTLDFLSAFLRLLKMLKHRNNVLVDSNSINSTF